MVLQLPPVPAALRSIQHYLKTAAEHENRDVVVTYWCRLFALQTALKLDKKSEEAKMLLIALMEWLEQQKRSLSDNEAITNEMAAQAHIENYAIKLFQWADGQDRASNFNKNVVKAFYTAAMLMEVLTTFGELGEDIVGQCKYAKWKAAYIHNCLKNGETPIPGPAGGENEDFFGENGGGPSDNNMIGFNIPPSQPEVPPVMPRGVFPSQPELPMPGQSSYPPPGVPPSFPPPNIPQSPLNPPTDPAISYNNPLPPQPPAYDQTPSDHSVGGFEARPSEPGKAGGIKLEPSQITKAQKYCKFAASALNYDDVSEAITNLQKALKLLQTGQDS